MPSSASAAIMFLTIAQCSTNANYKYSTVLFGNFGFALFGSHIGIKLTQFLGMNKENIGWKNWFNFGKIFRHQIFGAQKSCINAAHD